MQALLLTQLDSQRRSFLRFDRNKAVIAGLALAITGIAFWGLLQWPQVREWQAARLPLDTLVERAKQGQDPIFCYHAGMRLNRRQQYGEAIPLLEKGVGLAPERPGLRDEWARALLATGQTTRAFQELRQFVGIRPDLAEAHLLLGKFYQSQNAWKRAEEELRQAVRLRPSSSEAWSYLSAACYGHGNVAEAIQAAERAVSLEPNSYQKQLALASLLVGQKSPAAETPLEKAVRLAPDSSLAHARYAEWLLTVVGNPQRAVAEARSAASLSPESDQAQFLLGKALARSGKSEEAIAPLTKAARLSPNDPTIAIEVSRVYRAIGRKAEAAFWEREYGKREGQSGEWRRLMNALVVSPQSTTLNRQMAALLARQGDVVGCVRHTSAALHCAPDAPIALETAAATLMAAGRPDEANKLRQAIPGSASRSLP